MSDKPEKCLVHNSTECGPCTTIADSGEVRLLRTQLAVAERRAREAEKDSLRWQEISEEYRKERDLARRVADKLALAQVELTEARKVVEALNEYRREMESKPRDLNLCHIRRTELFAALRDYNAKYPRKEG